MQQQVLMMGCIKNPKLVLDAQLPLQDNLIFKKIAVASASAGQDYILLVSQEKELYFLFRNEQGVAEILPFVLYKQFKVRHAHANLYSLCICYDQGLCLSLKREPSQHYLSYPTFESPIMHNSADAILHVWSGLYHHFLQTGMECSYVICQKINIPLLQLVKMNLESWASPLIFHMEKNLYSRVILVHLHHEL